MRLTKYHKETFVKTIMQDVPSRVPLEEQITKIALADIVAQLPAEVAVLWNNPDLRPYVAHGWHAFGGVYLTHPTGDRAPCLTVNATLEMEALAIKVLEVRRVRRDLEMKLNAAIAGCTTLKSLHKAFPEFEKYMPRDTDVPTSRLTPVVANVMADFVKAGWPTTKKDTK